MLRLDSVEAWTIEPPGNLIVRAERHARMSSSDHLPPIDASPASFGTTIRTLGRRRASGTTSFIHAALGERFIERYVGNLDAALKALGTDD